MQEWSEKEIQEAIDDAKTFCLYLYTPLCGTCQVASRMLQIVNEMNLDKTIVKHDLNYLPEKAIEWEVKSVPCLILFKEGKIQQKVYAFHSVPYLLEVIQKL